MALTIVREIISESDLFDAYRNDPAVEALKVRTAKHPCACRGVIQADPIDPAPGVQDHQATRQHARWREDNEL